MRKIIAISSILILFAFFTAGNNTIAITNNHEETNISSANVYDLSAPVIILDLTEFNSDGFITVEIREIDTSIYNYSIEVNGTDLSSYITIDTPYHKSFTFDANVEFDNTPGLHNYLEVWSFNTGGIPSPYPSINQGGGSGGGGGWLFCDDQNCWGPMPLQPVKTTPKQTYTEYSVVNNTAPFPFFDLVSFPCCDNITLENYSGSPLESNSTTETNSNQTITYNAISNEGVSGTVIITWFVPTTITPYYIISSLVFMILYAIHRNRKKRKS
jgi:hypothetical protein